MIGELREVARIRAADRTVARQRRPDVLHAHSPVLGAMAAQRGADRLGLPLVYEIRAFWKTRPSADGTGIEGAAGNTGRPALAGDARVRWPMQWR